MLNTDPAAYGFQSWNQVVGQIHSHPSTFQNVTTGTFDPIDDTINDMTIPSAGDILNVDWAVAMTGNGAVYRSYILYKGQVYEYDRRDQNNNTSTDAETRRAASVKGTYDPNATCG